MLELKNLVKSYTTAGFTQKALDDVSVTLRDNEFVAVLGPSGSGKTTLLNIIGGLDHYDSGDLVIDGISTREYKDRDWDTYRNNRIGFVFQSYNLIPHQSVLSNVELALTLSGVPKAERREKARAALTEVGLEDHISKKPNQLSGGQMQRVAIARALVNDPEILLADEPTGALDSKTSVQIMDLLKKIASDRLVVMVTHNPELADEYANRVIRLADGRVMGDTNPVEHIDVLHEARPPRRAKMSFLTAVSLSFSNLMTKKGRTLMMAFAGSIGIIGIAGILALSNGVNNYIKLVEEDTLSVYPLTISSTGFDMTSLLVGTTMSSDDSQDPDSDEAEEDTGFSLIGGADRSESEAAEGNGVIEENKIISSMFDTVQSNDLAALKAHLEDPESGIDQYVNTIQYEYDVTPQIYLPATDPEVHQVNPDRSFAALGMGSTMSASSLMSMGMSTDVFSELLADYDIYSEQYEVLAGDWPHESDEVVLVLGSNRRISDFLLYSMGLRDYHDLNAMVEAFVNDEEIVTDEDRLNFTYDDIMDVEFKLVYNSDYFTHDDTYGVWVDRSDDTEFVKQLVTDGETLHISGIVAARDSSQTIMLRPGLYYTPALTADIIEHSEASSVTKDQLSNPTVNIFTGKTFVEEANEGSSGDFDMESLMEIDEEALSGAFSMDTSAMSNLDFGGILDVNSVMAAMPEMDLSGALAGVDTLGSTAILEAEVQNLTSAVLTALFADYSSWITDQNNLGKSMQEYMVDRGNDVVADAINGYNMTALQGQTQQYQDQMQTAITGYMQQYMTTMLTIMSEQISVNMSAAMSSLSANMANAMSIDTDAFTDAFQFNLDEAELTALMLSMMGGQQSSLNGNLAKLGYADYDNPYQISLYPFDFEGKQHILDILDAYNEKKVDEGLDEQVITYTDIVGTLMSSVTTIIDMISMVLVAFVAISLVVSSIMIGVITYISVLERKKEIGILRSIGASKGDIGNVFNAETLIVGFVAGVMGIAIVLLVSVPVNIIILQNFGIPNIVLLPALPAVVLIAVSCLLTFVAGLLPSSAASRKDPVEALRAE